MKLMYWMDLETTGLTATVNSIIEAAIVVTDEKLRELSCFDVLITPPFMASWDEPARLMHRESGLLDDLEAKGINHGVAEEALRDWMQGWRSQDENQEAPPLCGSSVHFDRSFLAIHMPALHSMFSYRNIDVSTVKELAARWKPDVFDSRPQDPKAHRALADARFSIEELKHYHKKFIK